VIPFEFALVAYVPIAALIMAMRNSALGFSLAYLIGLMFLPAGLEFDIPAVPDLSKENVPALGILIGTALFHPQLFNRFRFTALDLIFVFGAMCAFVTAMLNDFGMKFGASQTMDVFLSFFLPIILARIHLCTPRALRTFLTTLVLLACIYVPFSIWEFRMSPQFHTWVYGYFQHVFQQHFRGLFWRPIVFFYHALSLGRFYALAAFLALFPLRRELMRLFGPYGRYIFLVPLLGLVLEQSVSPIMLFCFLSVMYHAVLRAPAIIWVMPVIGYLWFAGVFAQIEVGFGGVRNISNVSSERAASFDYRLQALREYRSVVLTKPWFGWGGYGHGRIEGRATDSQLLVHLLQSGLLGAICYFGWWLTAMARAGGLVYKARGTPLATYAASFAAFASIGLTYTTVDAAVDHFMMFPLAGLYAIATMRARRGQGALRRRGNKPVRRGYETTGQTIEAH
jgi:hypothetical protein